jgi:hypothetical protein
MTIFMAKCILISPFVKRITQGLHYVKLNEIFGVTRFPAYAKASAGRRVGNNKYKEL